MKNVTPAAGQVWEGKSAAMWKVKVISDNEKVVHYGQGNYAATPLPMHEFIELFKFIPQTDLEWLAVYGHQNDDGFIEANRHGRIILGLKHPCHKKRYELGLDEPKSKITWADCPFPTININCPCTTAPLKKETTMIDLSTAKIGDEFVLRNGKVVSFFARTKMNSICQLKTGHAMLYEHSGKFDESVETGDKPKNWDIIAKHDSRTDEEKAIDDLIKPALIFAASSGSYQKDAEKFLNVIKADEIHGVKWVVE